MTIQQGMQEAFRRLGATEDSIEQATRLADTAFIEGAQDVRSIQIDQGNEERFIAAYMHFTELVEQGPAREALESHLHQHLSNN